MSWTTVAEEDSVQIEMGCGAVAAWKAASQIAAMHEISQLPRRGIAALGWGVTGMNYRHHIG